VANASDVQATGSTSLVTTAETAAATSSLVPEQNPSGQGVRISGVVNVTAGTATTAVQVRVRAGSGVTGTLIGNALTHTLAAGASASIPFDALDTTTVSAGLQYTVTVQQVAATGNGSVNQANISTTPVSGLPG
jgi:hypothetical protein